MAHEVPDDSARAALIDICVESWRLMRVFARVLSKLEAGEAPKYASQLRYFQKKVDDGLNAIGVKIVSVEGHPYDTGMAVSPLNIGDFEAGDSLVVEQMIEPILMGSEGVLKNGTVVLSKVG